MKLLSFWLRVCVVFVALSTVAYQFSMIAYAQDSGSQAIAQSYAIEGDAKNFVSGVLVSTKENSDNIVELATSGTAHRMVGVVTNDPLVELSSGNTETQVASSGTVPVAVSDINGSIKAGDKITASPIAGVGMLASGNDQVVGTAQNNFEANKAKSQEIKDNSGDKHTVHIGRVSLQVGISFYQAPSSGFIPPVIQGLANSVAGRQVSFIRIMACIALLLLAIASAAALLYGAVKSGLISIGRNPLAAKEIRRGLLQVGATITLILGLAIVASYIILTI